MGTVYYATWPKCEHCGLAKEPVGIGKGASTFLLWKYAKCESPTDRPLRRLEDWIRFLIETNATITPHSGAALPPITLAEFLRRVMRGNPNEKVDHCSPDPDCPEGGYVMSDTHYL